MSTTEKFTALCSLLVEINPQLDLLKVFEYATQIQQITKRRRAEKKPNGRRRERAEASA